MSANVLKHYPITVANLRASVCVATFWNFATVSIKVSHRKGQFVKFIVKQDDKVLNVWVDDYSDYTALRFSVRTSSFPCEDACIEHCILLIKDIYKYVNLSANRDLVSKELSEVLG